jgi:hypothetical protein
MESDADYLPLLRPSRSHYHLSRNEVMKGLANRFVHSTGYIYFYAGMAIASLLTVFISLLQDCPGTLFYSLELGINALLIAEVGIRGYAFGKVSPILHWKNRSADLSLVAILEIDIQHRRFVLGSAMCYHSDRPLLLSRLLTLSKRRRATWTWRGYWQFI